MTDTILEKDTIAVTIGDDHTYNCTAVTIGRTGENSVSQLEITLPAELCSFDAYLDFKKPKGETVSTPRLTIENGKIEYNLPSGLLDENGNLEVQLVLRNANGEVWKSATKKYVVLKSIDAADAIAEKEDFISEAQALLDEIQNSGGGGIVDQAYNPNSANAQSGKAVAQAIAGIGGGTGGADGKDGATFIPSVSEDGVISWTNDKGLANPASVNIKGEKGDQGEKGADGYTPIKDIDYHDGADGRDGEDGRDGTSVLIDHVEESTEDGGSNIVVFDNGTTLTVKNGSKGSTGANGKDGSNGKDGTSVTVSSVSESTADGGSNVVTFSDGKKVTIKNGSKGSKGDAGKTPVKGTDYFTEADKAEMVEDVKASLDGIPSYWVSALEEGVEAINTAVETAGRNKSAFLFYTDAHWGYGSGMSPNLLKYLGKHTALNKTIFGGDFGNTYDGTDKTMDEWMEIMREWKLAVRDIPNHHSVVGNHDRGDSGKISAIDTDKELYGFLFAPEETNDIVRGGDFFYYIDEPNERTRYLYLNTGLCDFSDEQCKFFIEALKTTPAEWHIVAVSHIWFVYADTSTPTVGSVPTNIQKVLLLFDAYNARATGSMTIDTESNAYDFTDCGAWVEFCIGGHTHVDYNFTSTNGIPVILCATDSKHLRGSGYTFTLGTTTESSVSGIVADYDAKKISVIRVGRGESSEIAITNYVVSYTNVLSTSLAADGTSVYNGKGYKENTRWSQSGQNESKSDGTYLTGWIKVPNGAVVRLKNMTTKSSNFTLLRATAPGSTSGSNDHTNTQSTLSGVVDDNGNIIQFKWDTDAPYIRIMCGGIDDTSIITINEPIE